MLLNLVSLLPNRLFIKPSFWFLLPNALMPPNYLWLLGILIVIENSPIYRHYSSLTFSLEILYICKETPPPPEENMSKVIPHILVDFVRILWYFWLESLYCSMQLLSQSPLCEVRSSHTKESFSLGVEWSSKVPSVGLISPALLWN